MQTSQISFYQPQNLTYMIWWYLQYPVTLWCWLVCVFWYHNDMGDTRLSNTMIPSWYHMVSWFISVIIWWRHTMC